jgi:hypothetical protein
MPTWLWFVAAWFASNGLLALWFFGRHAYWDFRMWLYRRRRGGMVDLTRPSDRRLPW